MDSLRVPPHNADTERSVLGCILLTPSSLDKVPWLLADHFYVGAHQTIFTAMKALAEKDSGRVDAVLLANSLLSAGTLDEVGGPVYIADIMDAVPHSAHIKYYAEVLLQAWQQRSAIYACTDVIKKCYAPLDAAAWEETLTEAEQKILGLRNGDDDNTGCDIESVLHGTMQELESRQSGHGAGLKTGFKDLDEQLGGIQPSEMVVMAARPSMGKTSLVCNIMENVAEQGLPVLLFSLEQSKQELGGRLLASQAQVNGHAMRVGGVSTEEMDKLMAAANAMSHLPIIIKDKPDVTMSYIAAASRNLHRQQRLGVIMIDYLQLIMPDDSRAVREQQVAAISRKIKYLAKELRVPVIALSQLNRDLEKRENKRPKLSDLRESGAIENDADIIMFLHRDDAYVREDNPGKAELNVAKHRGGETGIVHLTWRKEIMRFENYSPADDSLMVFR